MRIKSLLLFVTFMYFASCGTKNESLENTIIGLWAIEKIEFNHKDYKNYLYSNVLVFRENSEISIPESVHFIKDLNSNWKFNDKKKLIIETSNLAFKDTFNVKIIERTELKPIGIELKSDSIYIQAFNIFDLGD